MRTETPPNCSASDARASKARQRLLNLVLRPWQVSGARHATAMENLLEERQECRLRRLNAVERTVHLYRFRQTPRSLSGARMPGWHWHLRAIAFHSCHTANSSASAITQNRP